MDFSYAGGAPFLLIFDIVGCRPSPRFPIGRLLSVERAPPLMKRDKYDIFAMKIISRYYDYSGHEALVFAKVLSRTTRPHGRTAPRPEVDGL